MRSESDRGKSTDGEKVVNLGALLGSSWTRMRLAMRCHAARACAAAITVCSHAIVVAAKFPATFRRIYCQVQRRDHA